MEACRQSLQSRWSCSLIRVTAAVLIVGTSPSISAQVDIGDQIRKACSPIAEVSIISSRALDQTSEVFRSYASRWYYDGATSLDEAKNKGFQIDVVYKGVPLSAIWSDNSSRKKSARETWATFVDEKLAQTDAMSLDEVKRDPGATEAYNRCVALLSVNANDMACFFTPGTDRATAWLTVVLRPRSDFPKQKTTSLLTNGYLIPDLGALSLPESSDAAKRRANLIQDAIDDVNDGKRVTLPAGARTSLDFGGAVRTGTWNFKVARLNPNADLGATVRLANGLDCRAESLKPAAVREVEWSLWPEARNWETAGATFRYYHRKESCGKGEDMVPQTFCLANDDVVKSATPSHLGGNCGSRITAVKVPASPGQLNCVTVVGAIKGCGHDATRSCKGRGWVDTPVSLSGAKPMGDRRLAKAGAIERDWSHVLNGRFDYDLPLPADLVVDKWRYKIVFTDKTSSPPRVFTLSDDRPEYLDPVTGQKCGATVAKPNERQGFVSWMCSIPSVDAFRAMSQAIAGPDMKSVSTAAKEIAFQAPAQRSLAERIKAKTLIGPLQ